MNQPIAKGNGPSADKRTKLIERYENVIRVLGSLSRHERREHFDMSTFGRITDCGTVACAAGHCSLDPWFRKRGFASKPSADILGAKLVPTRNRNWRAMVQNFFMVYGNCDSIEYDGTDIFFNGDERSVSDVIRELRRFVARLRRVSSSNERQS